MPNYDNEKKNVEPKVEAGGIPELAKKGQAPKHCFKHKLKTLLDIYILPLPPDPDPIALCCIYVRFSEVLLTNCLLPANSDFDPLASKHTV